MSTVGIIAEFNPFHKGHEYIISEAKRSTKAEHCVIVMSGDFVQRGEPAVCDKYLRTRMALRGGADAVFELPVPYATGSAEIFAEAGIRLLTSLGCVDYVAFGSECGDIDTIMQCAEILVNEPPLYKDTLKSELKKGSSFPTAREAALSAQVNVSGLSSDIADIVKTPNNILAVEYCKAILRLRNTRNDAVRIPVPITIKRRGNSYSDTELSESGFSSATALRKELNSSGCRFCDDGAADLTLDKHLPGYAASLLKEEFGRTLPITADDLGDMLHIRLATISASELERSSDVGRDLANAIHKYASPAPAATFTGACEALKSKNNTYSAVSRALLHIILGIDSSHIETLRSGSVFPYARLLGFRTSASSLLRRISDSPDCVLITKLGDARTLLADNTPALALFETDIRAAAAYSQLVFSKYHITAKNEFELGIIRE